MLAMLRAGDFFGEIAALTGVPRTASVIAEQPTAVRQVMAAPPINRLFLNKMTERMARMNMIDLPRFAGSVSSRCTSCARPPRSPSWNRRQRRCSAARIKSTGSFWILGAVFNRCSLRQGFS